MILVTTNEIEGQKKSRPSDLQRKHNSDKANAIRDFGAGLKTLIDE